jgi:N-methylhydantoinase A
MPRENKHALRLAVDIGGTFTDLVSLDERSGKMGFEKTETTPDDPAPGVMDSIAKARLDLAQVPLFIHGTTLGLNALLENKGARTALITTRGFRDVLEIGRLDRPHMYDILFRKPPLLVRRQLRCEITERVNHRGEVLVRLDEAETRAAVRWLRQQGISVFAVCLLHSYANPAHEKRVGEIVREEHPGAYVSLSHTILQEFYEYERTVSTVINATIQPLMAKYLDHLWNNLVGGGFQGGFLITRSAGGAMSHHQAKETPVHTILSGPAGGVQGAVYLANELDMPNLIAIDAGGTSFDVSLIHRGEARVRTEAKVASYKLLLPVVDLETIGAGGGSIAWIDTGNALQVGPQSAAAHPGPICYCRGGTEPTVTDAAVSLGLINPASFLGGKLRLDVSAAERGIEERLAKPLRLNLQDTALGILAITETKMTGAIREMSVERGYDPREFSILAYGGAGPLFAVSLAEKVGVPQVIIPRWPGNFSAWGMLMFDVVQDFVQSYVAVLEETNLERVNEIFAGLERSALEGLARQGVPQVDQLVSRSVDMKYLMAGHVINVPVSNGALVEEDRNILRKRFNELHQSLYGHQLTDILQVVNFRVRAIGRVRKPELEKIPRGSKDPKSAHTGSRLIYEPRQRRKARFQIFDRDRLRSGNVLAGPAIVEEAASTTVIPAGWKMRVDLYGDLTLQREAS